MLEHQFGGGDDSERRKDEIDSLAERSIEAACMALGEHFDTVQIFVTHYDGSQKETRAYSNGCGNFYSRFGQVQIWLDMQMSQGDQTQ